MAAAEREKARNSRPQHSLFGMLRGSAPGSVQPDIPVVVTDARPKLYDAHHAPPPPPPGSEARRPQRRGSAARRASLVRLDEEYNPPQPAISNGASNITGAAAGVNATFGSVDAARNLTVAERDTLGGAGTHGGMPVTLVESNGIQFDDHAVHNFHNVLLLVLVLLFLSRRWLRRRWDEFAYVLAKKDDAATKHGLTPLSPASNPTPSSQRQRQYTGSPSSRPSRSPALRSGGAGGAMPPLDLVDAPPKPKARDSLFARASRGLSSVASGVTMAVGGSSAAVHSGALKRKSSMMPSPHPVLAATGESGVTDGHEIGMLPTHAFVPRCLNGQSLLRETERAAIASALPISLQQRHWALLYSSSVHGHSLSTLYHMAERHSHGHGPTLLVIEDDAGGRFGVFVTEQWRLSSKTYVGTGDMFVFTVRPRFQAFRWTGQNSFFVCGSDDALMIGGGGHGFALWLDESFEVRARPLLAALSLFGARTHR